MKKPHFILATCALILPALVLSSCGGGVSDNSVASIEGQQITKAQFTRTLQRAAASSGAANAAIPVPPNFEQCVAQQRKALPKPKKGQPAPTDKALRAQCKQQYEQLLTAAMGQLIQAKWILGEAKDMGIKVTDAEVQQSFESQKKQAYPKEKDFQKFLKQSGLTVPDILDQVRIGLVGNQIQQKVTKDKSKVSDSQVKEYYEKNKAQFAQPERRDLLVIVTKTKAQAEQAKKALVAGEAFAAVAKKYSIDKASKAQGGKLLGVAKGQQEQPLDQAVFAAKKSVIGGPVKTQAGYYVFKVTKVTAASSQSLAQATPVIKQQLQATNQQTALSSFVATWMKKWTGRTECQKGYVVQQCKNAKKTPTGTTPPPPIKTSSQPSGSQVPQQVPQAPQGQAPPTQTPTQ